MKKIIVALTASVVVLGLIALSQSVDSNVGRFLGNSNNNNKNNNNNNQNNGNGNDKTSTGVDSGDYTFYPYMDSDSGDIIYLPLLSVDKLKAYCNSNKACLGFNSNGWIKKSIKAQTQWVKWTGDSSKGFYVKKTAATTPSTPAAPTYNFYPYMDSDQGDIIYLPLLSIDKLKDYCNSNSACLGFNTNGWVKKVIKPQSQWVKWTNDAKKGFYVKVTTSTTPATPSTPTTTNNSTTNTGSSNNSTNTGSTGSTGTSNNSTIPTPSTPVTNTTTTNSTTNTDSSNNSTNTTSGSTGDQTNTGSPSSGSNSTDTTTGNTPTGGSTGSTNTTDPSGSTDTTDPSTTIPVDTTEPEVDPNVGGTEASTNE